MLSLLVFDFLRSSIIEIRAVLPAKKAKGILQSNSSINIHRMAFE